MLLLLPARPHHMLLLLLLLLPAHPRHMLLLLLPLPARPRHMLLLLLLLLAGSSPGWPMLAVCGQGLGARG